MTREQFYALTKTNRGFLNLAAGTDREGREWKVLESSLACEGAHVRLYIEAAASVGADHLHLSVAQARAMRDALATFIDAAESDLLTEPAEPGGEADE